MIQTMCRRCGLTHDGDDWDTWLSDHGCVPKARERVQYVPINAPAPMAHGDPRRYYSTTQPCRCTLCTQAMLDAKAPYRGADVRIAPSRERRIHGSPWRG